MSKQENFLQFRDLFRSLRQGFLYQCRITFISIAFKRGDVLFYGHSRKDDIQIAYLRNLFFSHDDRILMLFSTGSVEYIVQNQYMLCFQCVRVEWPKNAGSRCNLLLSSVQYLVR